MHSPHLIFTCCAQLGRLDRGGLQLHISWMPSYPTQHVVHMQVMDKNNSSFPFQIEFVATTPTPERTIVCRSPPGSTTTVPVHIHASGVIVQTSVPPHNMIQRAGKTAAHETKRHIYAFRLQGPRILISSATFRLNHLHALMSGHARDHCRCGATTVVIQQW